ncbi:hypothetical protein KA344_13475 [bacterium]|jgi:hypothetical protein|nr:hypothetical protein [bacterium]
MLKSLKLILAIGSAVLFPTAALAGANDFFGNSLPVGAGGPGAEPAGGSASANPTDFAPTTSGGANDLSGDEKRMQKKYREMLKHCQGLIAKGDKMIKDGEAHKDDKMLKKGKVLKGIGERKYAEFKANSPLPEDKKLPDLPVEKAAE